MPCLQSLKTSERQSRYPHPRISRAPAQNLAWERWRACDCFSTISLERIGLDGRLIVTGYETVAIAFTACVRETATEQARRGAVALGPPALVLVKLYGCNGGPM